MNPATQARGPEHGHGHTHDRGTETLSASTCSSCPGNSHDHEGADDDHDHEHGLLPGWPRIALALALATGAEAAHAFGQAGPGLLLAAVSIALAGLGVYRAGLQDLARLRLGISALMTVAVTGAALIGQWPEAAMVMALYVAAERIEHGAMDQARHAIRSLLDLAPETADVVQADASVRRQPAAE
ncbi:MAG: cation-transporting P-type ATPase, partial [Comamonas sp.]